MWSVSLACCFLVLSVALTKSPCCQDRGGTKDAAFAIENGAPGDDIRDCRTLLFLHGMSGDEHTMQSILRLMGWTKSDFMRIVTVSAPHEVPPMLEAYSSLVGPGLPYDPSAKHFAWSASPGLLRKLTPNVGDGWWDVSLSHLVKTLGSHHRACDAVAGISEGALAAFLLAIAPSSCFGQVKRPTKVIMICPPDASDLAPSHVIDTTASPKVLLLLGTRDDTLGTNGRDELAISQLSDALRSRCPLARIQHMKVECGHAVPALTPALSAHLHQFMDSD